MRAQNDEGPATNRRPPLVRGVSGGWQAPKIVSVESLDAVSLSAFASAGQCMPASDEAGVPSCDLLLIRSRCLEGGVGCPL